MIDGAARAALAAYSVVTPVAFGLMAERCGGRAIRVGGALFAEGPHPAAEILNCAFRVDPTAPPGQVLADARAHFEPRGFAYSVWSQAGRDRDLDDAAAAGGWTLAIELPAMIIAHPVAERSVPGATLRAVATAEDRASFAAIAAETLGEGDGDRRAYRSVLTSPDLFRDGCAAFIAEYGGADAAVAWIAVIDGTGLVGWVGTLDEYRRRGLGALVTAATTNAGFALGASLVTLQASPRGRPVYAALGYEAISSESLWLPPGDGPRVERQAIAGEPSAATISAQWERGMDGSIGRAGGSRTTCIEPASISAWLGAGPA